MALRSALLSGLVLIASTINSWAQQPAPAQLGITTGSVPEVLQVLDASRNWAPIGNVDPTLHTLTLTAHGREADIVVTDPDIGWVDGGADNSPWVQNLMNKMGPPTYNPTTGVPVAGGYDVNFPGKPSQPWTEYYLTDDLTIIRSANYHCSGRATNYYSYPSTMLIFAPGKSLIEESTLYTTDGSQGGGTFSGCTIFSMGYGTATANPLTPNTLKGVYFRPDPQGVVPLPTWQVGDGILLIENATALFPTEAIPEAPLGTTITAVGAMGGDGNPAGQQNLTLSNPVSQFAGSSSGTHSQAVFTPSGTNFNNLDTITVGITGPGPTQGAITYTFRTVIGSAANSVLIGPNFPASAANLVAAIMNTVGQNSTYYPNTTGPQGYAPNQQLTASYTPGGSIIFTSRYSGPGANTLASTYSTTGTPAGSFGGATFSGANDTGTAADVPSQFYQLPVSQVYKVQTLIGSNSVTVISGPHPLHTGDVIVSDAFPITSTVNVVNQLTFPQIVTIFNPMFTAVNNATVTHAVGAEGNLWIMPGVTRRTGVTFENIAFDGWPIPNHLACNGSTACSYSIDKDNVYYNNLFGRWIAGSNNQGSISINEKWFTGGSFINNVFSGPNRSETYLNLSSLGSKWPFIAYCGTGTPIFGGYSRPTANQCANTTSMYPPTPGGAINYSPQSSYGNGPSITTQGLAAQFRGIGPWQFYFGPDNNNCFQVGGTFSGSVGAPMLALSPFGCNFLYGFGAYWNYVLNSLDWNWNNTVPVFRFFSVANQGYTGYGGIGYGIYAPQGAIFGGDGNSNPNTGRSFGMSNVTPIGLWHAQGNTIVNTVAPAGGAALRYSLAGSSQFQGTIAGNTLTALYQLQQTPPTGSAPPVTNGGSGYATGGGANVAGSMTGNFAGCTTQPVMNVTASAVTGAIISAGVITTRGLCPTIPANAPWTPNAPLLAGTGADFLLTWGLPYNGSTNVGLPAVGQTITGTLVAANTKLIAGSGNSFTTSGAPQTISTPTIMSGQSWTIAGPISNDPANPDYTMTTLRSGSSLNTDLTGRLTLVAGSATYSMKGTYNSAAPPDCGCWQVPTAAGVPATDACTVFADATVNPALLTFTGTGTDTIKYICAGRN
jgi:hypothetical protein